jgi:hypothetical protein
MLLASGARAEITYMNCKFNEGWHQKGTKREDVKKMSDLTISMDKEKRRIKITDRDFEPYDIYKDSMRWSHKWTGWVNPFEPINKGRLGSTQEWRIEKPKKHYY